MRLTRAAEYAFRSMRYLASRKEERWYSIQEIAEAEEMPIQFLAKVMQHLTQAGLVHSACGKTGGYRLGKPASQIRMADIHIAMEGPLNVNTCLLYPTECRFYKICKTHHIWEELQAAMVSVLEKYTVEDIIIAGEPEPSTKKRKTPARARAVA
jgi:Rrf2 family protein